MSKTRRYNPHDDHDDDDDDSILADGKTLRVPLMRFADSANSLYTRPIQMYDEDGGRAVKVVDMAGRDIFNRPGSRMLATRPGSTARDNVAELKDSLTAAYAEAEHFLINQWRDGGNMTSLSPMTRPDPDWLTTGASGSNRRGQRAGDRCTIDGRDGTLQLGASGQLECVPHAIGRDGQIQPLQPSRELAEREYQKLADELAVAYKHPPGMRSRDLDFRSDVDPLTQLIGELRQRGHDPAAIQQFVSTIDPDDYDSLEDIVRQFESQVGTGYGDAQLRDHASVEEIQRKHQKRMATLYDAYARELGRAWRGGGNR